MEFQPQQPAPFVPDDVTVPQFIFDGTHETRPARRPEIPWLVEDATGRKIFEDEVRGL